MRADARRCRGAAGRRPTARRHYEWRFGRTRATAKAANHRTRAPKTPRTLALGPRPAKVSTQVRAKPGGGGGGAGGGGGGVGSGGRGAGAAGGGGPKSGARVVRNLMPECTLEARIQANIGDTEYAEVLRVGNIGKQQRQKHDVQESSSHATSRRMHLPKSGQARQTRFESSPRGPLGKGRAGGRRGVDFSAGLLIFGGGELLGTGAPLGPPPPTPNHRGSRKTQIRPPRPAGYPNQAPEGPSFRRGPPGRCLAMLRGEGSIWARVGQHGPKPS